MSTFKEIADKVIESFDDVEEVELAPMRGFVKEMKLVRKKKGEPRLVDVTIRIQSDQMFSNPEDVGSNFVGVPVIGFIKPKKSD